MSAKIFVSSTIKDLKHLRTAISDGILELGHEPILSEELRMDFNKGNSFDSCMRAIEECDFYILVVGDTYGTESDTGRSITHEELIHAKRLKKHMMVFVESDTWTLANKKLIEDPKFAAFVDEARGDWQYAKKFDDFRVIKEFIQNQLSFLLRNYIQTGYKPEEIPLLEEKIKGQDLELNFLTALLKYSKDPKVTKRDFDRILTNFNFSFTSGYLQDVNEFDFIEISKPKGITLWKANTDKQQLEMLGGTGDINAEKEAFDFKNPDSFVAVTYDTKDSKVFSVNDDEQLSNKQEIVVCYNIQTNFVLAIHLYIETIQIQVKTLEEQQALDYLTITEIERKNKKIFTYLNVFLKNLKEGE